MKVLIDTHAFLWLLDGDTRLSRRCRQVFLDRANELHLSVASLWEIAVKLSLGKLALAADWHGTLLREMRANAVHWLPIEPKHCLGVVHLPFHHRDPFDRMLVAQAVAEDMTLLTADPQLRGYAVTCIW